MEYSADLGFRIAKASFGSPTLGHNGTDAQVDSDFGGITTPGVNSASLHQLSSDFLAQWTRNWKHYDFREPFIHLQRSIQRSVQRIALNKPGRKSWNVRSRFCACFGRKRGPQPISTFYGALRNSSSRNFPQFTLKSAAPRPASIQPAPQLIRFCIEGGFRWQRRVSSIEFGPEAGHQWDAIMDSNFFRNGVVTATCLAESVLSYPPA